MLTRVRGDRHVLGLVPLLVVLAAATAGWAQGGAQAEKDFAFAEGLYEQENYQLAVGKYVEFIGKYPGHPNMSLAVFRAGECSYRLGKHEEAVPYFERVTREFPTSEQAEPAWLWLGDSYYKAGQYEQAGAAYESLLRTFPQSEHGGRAAYWRAESYYRQGKYDEAIAAYKDALQRKPGEETVAYALYSIGLAHLQLKQNDEAVTYLAEVVGKYKTSPIAAESQYLLGAAYQAAGQQGPALEAFRKVLTDYGDSSFAAHAQVGLAWAQFQQGQYDAALESFQKVATDHPDSPAAAEARLREADCLYHLRRWDEAATAYERLAGEQGSQWADEALYWLAVTYEQQGDAAKALATHGRLVKEFPSSPRLTDAYLHLGQLQIAAGDLDAAVATFQAAEKAAPDPGRKRQATAGLAWAKYQVGLKANRESPDALAELEQIVREDPASPLGAQLAGLVGRAHYNAARYEPALAMLTLLAENHPEHEQRGETLYLIGACHERSGRTDQAADSYRQVLEKAGGSAYAAHATAALVGLYAGKGELEQVRGLTAELEKAGAGPEALAFCSYKLGDALYEAKSYAEAASAYEKALAAAPASDFAPYAQVGLAWARLSAGDLTGAVEAFRAVAEKHAGSQAAGGVPEGLLAVGERLFDEGKYAESQALYEQTIAAFPASDLADEAEYKLGWALLEQDRKADAEPHFARAAETANVPQIAADARYQAGRLIFDRGDYVGAAAMLEPFRQKIADEAWAAFDKTPWALVVLGQAQERLQKPDQAAQAFLIVADRYREHPARGHALLGLARGYRAGKQPDKALEALQAMPQDLGGEVAAEAQYELAACYRDKDDLAKAAEEFLKVSILYRNEQWGAVAQYEAGQCYEQLQDMGNAAKCYKAVLDRYAGQAEVVAKARERLAAIGAQD